MNTPPNKTRIDAFLGKISTQVAEILHERADDIFKLSHDGEEITIHGKP